MKLAYEKSGQGTPRLLLLHGFTGSRAAWDHLRTLLGPHIGSIAVDLPGHGQSEPCSFSGREGFTQTLAALVGVLDELGAGPVDVLGYSQGARLALGLAIDPFGWKGWHAPRAAWPALCDRSVSECSPITGPCSRGFEPQHFS